MKNKIKVEDLIETMKFENWSKEELVMELNSRCRVINIKANELIKKAKKQTITEIKKKIEKFNKEFGKDLRQSGFSEDVIFAVGNSFKDYIEELLKSLACLTEQEEK